MKNISGKLYNGTLHSQTKPKERDLIFPYISDGMYFTFNTSFTESWCDQYTIQGDLFSQAILNNSDVPTPIEDAVKNMRVIDAIVDSSRNQRWTSVS